MHKKLAVIILFIIILESLLFPISFSSEETFWWNDNWSFRQEILIPINTSVKEAKFQPIDINFVFNNSCWAKNENENSIRVIFQDKGKFIELESQIYELNYLDDEYIASCNLVFLIPEEASGNEKYYVYYDDEKKTGPNYENHVDIQESYYTYEPLQGFKFESYFYKIIEDGNIVYAVNKKGTYLGESASQQVTKLEKYSKEVKPSNSEQVVSLSFVYWWLKNGKWSSISSGEEIISSQIIANGNLMIYFGIISQSKDKALKTTVYYKYYYCPTENKRIQTHVKHEIISHPLPTGDDIDLAFAIIPFSKFKSSNIKELNFGEIPPYLHFYSEDNHVITYEIDQYPESSKWQEMIGKKNDFDLGDNSWLSFGYGETGKTHSLIFETNKILKSGAGEMDGMELQLYESNNVQLPGLSGYIAYLYVMRNAYEEGKLLNIVLPKDYVVEFNAEFFTAETGGFSVVEKESEIYKKLISYKPFPEKDLVDEGKEKKEFELKTYVHLPLKLLSKLFGFKAFFKKTYISAELSDEKNNLIAYGRVGRVSLTDKFKIDWKNLSLFRKIVFPHILTGKYIVKIYLENTLFDDDRKFIGYNIVDLQKDKTIHIFCKSEGKIHFFVYDQNNKGIENAQISLLKQDFEVIKGTSDSKGKIKIEAPCGLKEKYTVNLLYKGFLINKQEIRLGRIRRFLPLTKKFSFPVYDLTIDFKNSKDEKPDFNVNISITSNEMYDPVFLYPDSESNGVFYFKNLYPADYTLSIKYNQFEVKKFLPLQDSKSIVISLFDFTILLKDNWNFSTFPDLDVSLSSDDFEKVVVISAEKASSEKFVFRNLYPGNYSLKIGYLGYLIKMPINIGFGKNIKTIIFPAEYNLTINVFDTRGNFLKDAKVLIFRTENNEKKLLQGFTDEQGNVIFSVPPASYDCEIYYNENLIAKRKIDVLNEKSYDIITTCEPFFLNVLIIVFIVLILFAILVSLKKKDIGFFLKFFAIVLTIISLFYPWWSLNGSSNKQYETSTNVFLMPVKMVTIFSSENVTAGEITLLDEAFTFVIKLIPFLIVIGFFGIITIMILKKHDKKRLSFIVFILTLIIFIGTLMMFYFIMSELTSATVGGFYGQGGLDVNIPGEKMFITMVCNWGGGIGFYLIFVSIILLFFSFLLDFKQIIFFNKKNYKL